MYINTKENLKALSFHLHKLRIIIIGSRAARYEVHCNYMYIIHRAENITCTSIQFIQRIYSLKNNSTFVLWTILPL